MIKKIYKGVVAFFIAMLLIVSTLFGAVYALAENNVGVTEFNLFRDAGEITDEFISSVSELSKKYQNDYYFSFLVMTFGDSKMFVDGEEVVTDCPATMYNGEILLPVIDIAEILGAQASVDTETGNIKIENRDHGANFDIDTDTDLDGIQDMILEKNIDLECNNDTSCSGIKDAIVSEDNVSTKHMENGDIITKMPTITQTQAEDVFGLNIIRDGDKLIITKPYQTKEIILFVKDGKTLKNNRGACEFITNNQGLYFLQYSSEELTKSAYEGFKQDAEIQYVTLNELNVATDIPSPGSWGTNGNENSMGIQANRMKNHLEGNNENIIVAVVDTGVDAEYLPETEGGREGHPHLKGRTTAPESATDNTAGFNFVDNNNNAIDGHGHGTHVSGTIVDCSPNNVKIMPIKSLNSKGEGIVSEDGKSSSVSNGMRYAVDHNAKVINLSLKAGCVSDNCLHIQAINYAIDKAKEKGENPPIFVVGSGNDGIDVKNACPARLSTKYDNVITVGAVNQYDLPAYFSNYGDAVDVCAPGVDILSSIPGGGYDKCSGTSMATPHVTAAVAMLMLEYPEYTPGQIKNLLKSMTVDLGEPGWDSVFGNGRIDFRMFNSSSLPSVTPIAATGFNLKKTILYRVSSCTSVTLNNLFEEVLINAHVFPMDATDKSVRYLSENNSIATYKNGRIVAKSPGTTTITAKKSGLPEKAVNVTVGDTQWLYHVASSFAGGTGTKDDPYLIDTAEQLAKISYDSKYDNKNFYGKYFKMTSDIDLKGKYWTPIKQFRGIFDGNGFTIMNMDVKESIIEDRIVADFEYSGLIASTYSPAKIENLAVLNAKINVPSFEFGESGILCASTYGVEISNCYTTGSVPYGAGIVGRFAGESIMRNCYSIVEGSNAGLVNENANSSIYNSYSAGTVKSSGSGFSIIQKDYSSENSSKKAPSIINSFSTINTESGNGFMEEKRNGSIQKCYYLSDNTYGIRTDKEPSTTDLIGKPISFFKNQSTYTTASNWDSSSPWDFEEVWEIDENYNNGLPYLKEFRREYPVTSITLNKSILKLTKGQTETLIATVTPVKSTKSFTWTSSNGNVATVDQNGKVTAKASSGTAIITITANDGSGKSASCTFYADDHSDADDAATTIKISSKTSGNIEISGDVDCFKFVPTKTGNYLFYTTGSTDTKGALYDSAGTVLKQNDDANIEGLNFAFIGSLTAGQTYYIKVSAHSTKTGAYTLCLCKDFYTATLADTNQDARRVQMQAEAASILTRLDLKIGDNTYTLNKPASGDLDVTVNGARFKVIFKTGSNGLITTWKIEANIPATAKGTTDTVSFTFSKGVITAKRVDLTGLVAYKSSIKTGIDARASDNLQKLLTSMQSTGYTLSVRNWDNTLVNVTESTKAATGMKIIQKDSGGKIVEIYYVVLFGDVTGTGTVNLGDGEITTADGLATLQASVDKVEFKALAALAADVNHDGHIGSDDALIINQHAVGKVTIDQNYEITTVPDDCYFLDPVVF